MLKKRLLVIVLTMACLIGMGGIVEAEVTCDATIQLSLDIKSGTYENTTDQALCYQVTDISSTAVSFALDVNVINGRVNVYWASGDVTTFSRRINAQKDLTGYKRFLPIKPPSNPDTYTLAIVPTEQSTFRFTLKALEPSRTAVAVVPNTCPDDTDDTEATCTNTQPLDEGNPILNDSPGSEAVFLIEATCPSHMDASISWTSGTYLELRLVNDLGLVTFAGGTTSLQLGYDTTVEERLADGVWQWTLINVNGGSVKGLNTRLNVSGGSCYDPKKQFEPIPIIRTLTHDDSPVVPPVPQDPVLFEPTPTPEPIPSAVATCPNGLIPRLSVGGYGRVTPGNPNSLRHQPTDSTSRFGIIPGEEVFLVLEGPVCADTYTWWKARYNGLEGWTAESGQGVYWVDPIQPPFLCDGAQPPRLVVGQYGRVTPGNPNTIRPEPRGNINGIGEIPGGARFYVVDGPICSDYMWWKVAYNGIEGWTAESGQNSVYWLEPDK